MIKSYARASALLSLEAGIAKHCLGAKIVVYSNMHVCNFNSEICCTTKVPLPVHVRRDSQ